MERTHSAGAVMSDRGRQPLPSIAWEESIQDIKPPHLLFFSRPGPSICHRIGGKPEGQGNDVVPSIGASLWGYKVEWGRVEVSSGGTGTDHSVQEDR